MDQINSGSMKQVSWEVRYSGEIVKLNVRKCGFDIPLLRRSPSSACHTPQAAETQTHIDRFIKLKGQRHLWANTGYCNH